MAAPSAAAAPSSPLLTTLERKPMVSLHGLERARSTLRDFVLSYFMFHDLDPATDFWQHMPLLVFVEVSSHRVLRDTTLMRFVLWGRVLSMVWMRAMNSTRLLPPERSASVALLLRLHPHPHHRAHQMTRTFRRQPRLHPPQPQPPLLPLLQLPLQPVLLLCPKSAYRH
jgi:hypothetical protein